jgi:hypothetical protein
LFITKGELKLINLPDLNDSFTYENFFYLSCESSRIEKILTQYSIFSKSLKIPGAIIECGVFKGASFARYAMFRKIHKLEDKPLIGFDAFGFFPETSYEDDKKLRDEFIEIDGEEGISVEQLNAVLENKSCSINTQLIKGDICETVPSYVEDIPSLKISFINLDVDIYEPSKTVLENLYPLLSPGGVIVLDNYSEFPGETKAADDYFKNKDIFIQKDGINKPIYYVVKK